MPYEIVYKIQNIQSRQNTVLHSSTAPQFYMEKYGIINTSYFKNDKIFHMVLHGSLPIHTVPLPTCLIKYKIQNIQSRQNTVPHTFTQKNMVPVHLYMHHQYLIS